MKRTAFWIAVAAAGIFCGPALAQDTITLKFAHVFPANHYLWEVGGKTFTDAVTAATNGKVKFEVYPAAQLGRDSVSALQSGLADVAVLLPSYQPEKLPLSSVAELPGHYSTSCEGTDRLWNVAKEGGVLSESEYKPQGLRVLYATTITPYKLMTTTKAISKLEDVAGLKIRANGAAMEKTLRSLGGVPVQVVSPELYDAASRGTVDGALYPYSGLYQFDLQKVLRHSLEFNLLGSGTQFYTISERTWQKLPDDVKEIMLKEARNASKALCDFQDQDEESAGQKIVAEEGTNLTKLSDEEARRWTERLDVVATEWASDMNAAGKNGTEVLEAFRANP